MTSHDVREMLDLPGEAGPRPTKKQKIAAPRPVLKGLAREVLNLGGDNPIAIVPEVMVFKKKRFGSRKPAAKWDLKPFKNSARNGDGLVLRHWRRKTEVPPAPLDEDGNHVPSEPQEPEIEDSTFAKFNVKVNTPQYTPEQYNLNLQSQDWSKAETDYLLALVQEYDIRWPVIWDRYEYQAPAPNMDGEASETAMVMSVKVRSMEDLKARYYAVAAAMMKVNTKVEVMNHAEFNLLELMQGFNPEKEVARKKFAEAAFKRTKEEAQEEQSLLMELKRILARSEKLTEERRELYALLEAPVSTANVGIYSSSSGLSGLFTQLMTVDKSKKRKSLMGGDGVSPASGGPSSLNQQPSFDRRDSVIRESISGPSGGASNNKKGPSQSLERRQLTAEEEAMYGVKRFERITTSGPSFRHERIKKPMTSKSAVQQAKITNILTELQVPPNLTMPTAAMGEAFENLLNGINTLLDQRKLLDKLQGELNTVLALKAERERRERAERGEPEPETEGDGEAEPEAGEAEKGVKVEEETREKSAAPSLKSGGGHKRSASVMSTVSDKSAKRQKK